MSKEFVIDIECFENDATAAAGRTTAVLECLEDVLSELEKLELGTMGKALIIRASRLCDVARGCNGEVHEALEGLSAVVERCGN